MAFPLEASHLISHLRSSYLVLYDDDEEIRRTLHPYPEDHDNEVFKHIFDSLSLLSSPPIDLNTPDEQHDNMGLRGHSKSYKKKNKIRHKRKSIDPTNNLTKPENLTTDSDKNDFEKPDIEYVTRSSSSSSTTMDVVQNSSGGSISPAEEQKTSFPNTPLNYTTTIKKGKKKPNLIRLFQRDNNGYDTDSSEGSIRTTKLDTLDENASVDSDATQKFTGNDSQATDQINNSITSPQSKGSISEYLLPDASEEIPELISKDSNVAESLDDNLAEGDDDNDAYSYEDGEYEDDYGDDDEVSSSDSAFTDIDGDSLIEDSLLLDSFDTSDFEYSKKTKMLSSKLRKKRNKLHSYTSELQSSKASTLNTERASKLNTSTSSSALSSLRGKKPSVKFEKITVNSVKPTSKSSNLSSLIQSRNNSAITNPLNYYSFVNDDSLLGNSVKVSIDVFVPPQTTPTIKELSINNNIAVSDCIGYILLHLSDLDEFKKDPEFSLYPNNWRLELVDEDGENYGSFGVLDRTRLLSSYNNPKELAICRVTNEKEMKKNEVQSPLAIEFKENLVQYNRSHLEKTIEENEDVGSNSEDIQLTITDTKGSQYYISANTDSSVQELLYDFCSQKNLDPKNFMFRLVMNSQDQAITVKDVNGVVTLTDNLLDGNTVENKRYLSKNELIRELESTTLEIVPSRAGPVKSLLGNGSNELSPLIDNTISPNQLNVITPPVRSSTLMGAQVNEKPQVSGAKRSSITGPIKQADSKAHEANSSRYFDDMISGFNSQLPERSKGRYFSWKVWRKKTTILNKIEKALIIDGDYIRLQAPEDKAFTANPSENPFLASQAGVSHHRHLHHYNYSNYYNSSMLKTSSFHITQIVKLKQYKGSKNPNHFKIVIEKVEKDSTIKKKYDLEAVNEQECEDIINKIRWVINIYNQEMSHIK